MAWGQSFSEAYCAVQSRYYVRRGHPDLECDQLRFSFVISYESRGGPGLQGNPGFAASWRPVHQNRPAVKVDGSPFKTFIAAEQACEVMLGHLISDSPSFGRAPWTN